MAGGYNLILEVINFLTRKPLAMTLFLNWVLKGKQELSRPTKRSCRIERHELKPETLSLLKSTE